MSFLRRQESTIVTVHAKTEYHPLDGCHAHVFVGMLITNVHMPTSEDVRGHGTQSRERLPTI